MNESDLNSSILNDSMEQSPFFRVEFRLITPLIWAIITVIGTTGNGLVIYTLGKNGEMNPTNCFVINLAVADLIFILILVPISAAGFAFNEYVFGDAVCKMTTFMIYVTVHATCLTLMAMTIDRYHAIVHPVSSMNWRSRKATSIVSLIVWAVSFLLSIPFALFHGTIETIDNGPRTYCLEQWPTVEFGKILVLSVICTTYVIPLTVIISCYFQIVRNLWRSSNRKRNQKQEEECNGSTPLSSDAQLRRRKKVTRMVAIVVLLFAFFWLPVHVFNIYRIFTPDFPRSIPLYVLKIFCHTLSYSNSCVNPFVYAFLNDGFRKAFSKTFPLISKWCPCTKLTNNDRYTHVAGMVDQAIQAAPGEENDINGNGGTEMVSMTHASDNKNYFPKSGQNV